MKQNHRFESPAAQPLSSGGVAAKKKSKNFEGINYYVHGGIGTLVENPVKKKKVQLKGNLW
jgi:hypothetical protein